MAEFFRNEEDILSWIRNNFENVVEATERFVQLSGKKYEQDIVDAMRQIFDERNPEHAAEFLWGVLLEKNIVKGKPMKKTQESTEKINKKAYMEKFPERATMEQRMCPKLPRQGVSQGLVSTYNCRRWCKDAIIFDEKLYCAEALWRRHMMDKYSREFMDKETGRLEGGYINGRFHVCRDEFPETGEEKNTPRMSLGYKERTRKPTPRQYSIERRLEEQRKKGSTESITISDSDNKMEKTAAIMKTIDPVKVIHLVGSQTMNPDDETVSEIFKEAIDLHFGGESKEEAILKMADKLNISIKKVAVVQEAAIHKLKAHGNDWYTMQKTAENLKGIIPGKSITARNLMTGQKEVIESNPAALFRESEKPEHIEKNVYQLYDTSSGELKGLYVIDPNDSNLQTAGVEDSQNQISQKEIQDAAFETGLIDEPAQQPEATQ